MIAKNSTKLIGKTCVTHYDVAESQTFKRPEDKAKDIFYLFFCLFVLAMENE